MDLNYHSHTIYYRSLLWYLQLLPEVIREALSLDETDPTAVLLFTFVDDKYLQTRLARARCVGLGQVRYRSFMQEHDWNGSGLMAFTADGPSVIGISESLGAACARAATTMSQSIRRLMRLSR